MMDDKTTMDTPCYIYPVWRELRELMRPDAPTDSGTADRRRELASVIAVNVGDPLLLRALLGEIPDTGSFYGDLGTDTPDTVSAIDTFLTTYTRTAPASDDARLTVAPAIDYAAAILDGEDAGTPLRTDTPAPGMGPADVATPADSLPEENGSAIADNDRDRLAKAIKSGQYGEAIEIIQAQNLKNPQKSIYFADQLRFLRKLQFIESMSNKDTGSNQ